MSEQLRSVQTPWTDIIAAQRNPVLRAACLEMLAAKYHGPVHAYIRRALHIHKPEAVDDLTQGFFLRFLAQNAFDRLDRERGSLRGFLMRSVTNYVRDELRKKTTRNAESPFSIHDHLPEGEAGAHGDSPPTPEEEFNRRWARERFDEAKEVFRHYCNDKGKPHYWEVFKERISTRASKTGIEATAARLGVSEKDVANWQARSTKKFQSILYDVIRGTASDAEAERELADLIRYFKP